MNKKNIISLLLALTCIACDPPEHTMTHEACWYIKNHNQEKIIISRPTFSFRSIDVNPGDSAFFYVFNPAQHLGEPSFDLLLWEIPEEDRYIDILSAQGVLLKRWYYADKDAEGKQIFNESCWRLYTEHFEPGVTQVIYKWVFDIYPEDLFGDDALLELKQLKRVPSSY